MSDSDYQRKLDKIMAQARWVERCVIAYLVLFPVAVALGTGAVCAFISGEQALAVNLADGALLAAILTLAARRVEARWLNE